jgi:flagellar assembly factor FliW
MITTTEQKATVTKPSAKPFRQFVAMPVKTENVFRFPAGIPAFEDVKEFVFLCKPDTQPFVFMQALPPAELVFVCIDPFLIYPGYAPRIGAADTRTLRLNSPGDALLFNICTITPDARDITANMQAPIIINIRTCIGKQILCDDQDYPIRYRIWDALEATDQGDKAKPAPGNNETKSAT